MENQIITNLCRLSELQKEREEQDKIINTAKNRIQAIQRESRKLHHENLQRATEAISHK